MPFAELLPLRRELLTTARVELPSDAWLMDRAELCDNEPECESEEEMRDGLVEEAKLEDRGNADEAEFEAATSA